jgi:integrase
LKQFHDNNNKDSNDVKSTKSFDLDGGQTEKWKEFITRLSQNHINQQGTPMGDMGDLEYVKKINRLNCPIVLDPANSTFDDVALHGYLRQRLALSTIAKRLTYARFMETHLVPVDFRNPNYENFIHHMDYREEIEKATSQALRHEWKTMTMFLRAYGIVDDWNKYRAPHYEPNIDIVIPYPEIVNKFFSYDYSKNQYTAKLYQYIFFFGFTIGVRPPSELCNLNVTDIIIEGKRGSVTITEEKKHGHKRTVIPERFILVSPNRKSLKNYIDKWRPMVADDSEIALFLTPEGKRFTPDYLRAQLTQHGQKIWKPFHPYTMRHWCATARMIEWNYNLDRVSSWLGHSHLDMTKRYVHMAEEYYKQDQGSWLRRAIRSPSKIMLRCKHADTQENRYIGKKASIDEVFSCKKKRAWRDSNPRPIG